MWLGYACSLLFVISYHWHPPLHIHIYTCQILHLYPPGGDQVLRHLLASLTVPPSLFASHTWLSIPFDINDVCFGPSPQAFLRRPFASLPLLFSQRRRANHGPLPWYVGVPAVSMAARQAASSLPLFGAFGSITAGAHLMWSPHLTTSSLPRAQTAGGTVKTKGAADCCRPFTCKYREQAWVWVQYWRCPLHWGSSVCAYMSVCAYTPASVYDCVWSSVCMSVCFHVCAWHDPVHLNYTAAKLLQMF